MSQAVANAVAKVQIDLTLLAMADGVDEEWLLDFLTTMDATLVDVRKNFAEMKLKSTGARSPEERDLAQFYEDRIHAFDSSPSSEEKIGNV